MFLFLSITRTLFLIFLFGYAARGFPFANFHVPRTFDEQYSIIANNNGILQKAVAYAMIWITFEAIAGWVLVARRKKAVVVEKPAT